MIKRDSRKRMSERRNHGSTAFGYIFVIGLLRTPLRSQTTSWFQIIQVSVAAFCIPGMYNAMSGTGGGGNVDRGFFSHPDVT
jgi:hypothetical protein